MIGREECNRFICFKRQFWLCFFALKLFLLVVHLKSVVLFPLLWKEYFFKEGNMTDGKKVVWAREQLISKQTELGRLPQKSDFDEVTRSRIKAFLGPWPRALESAGLKQKKN